MENFKTFCSKSWTDINIDFELRSLKHCCKAKPYDFPVKLEESFISMSDMIKERRSLSLKNIAHDDCKHCWNDYSKGKSAFRDWANRWNDDYISKNLHKLDTDDLVSYIEIKPDRICDMACLYCSHSSSSKIAQEEGITYEDKTNNEDYEVFKNWIKNYLIKQEINKQIVFIFLGGEPTASDRFHQLADFIEEQAQIYSHLKIRLEICTNANSKPFLMNKMKQRLDKGVVKWGIGISNESFGQTAELIRHGLNWQRFENNFKIYISHPNTELLVMSPTINVFNLKTFPAYINWVFEQFFTYAPEKEFTWFGNYISWPEEMDIVNLPLEYLEYVEEAEQVLLSHSSNKKWLYQDNFLDFISQMKVRVGQNYNNRYKENIIRFLEKKQQVKKNVDLNILLENIDK